MKEFRKWPGFVSNQPEEMIRESFDSSDISFYVKDADGNILTCETESGNIVMSFPSIREARRVAKKIANESMNDVSIIQTDGIINVCEASSDISEFPSFKEVETVHFSSVTKGNMINCLVREEF